MPGVQYLCSRLEGVAVNIKKVFKLQNELVNFQKFFAVLVFNLSLGDSLLSMIISCLPVTLLVERRLYYYRGDINSIYYIEFLVFLTMTSCPADGYWILISVVLLYIVGYQKLLSWEPLFVLESLSLSRLTMGGGFRKGDPISMTLSLQFNGPKVGLCGESIPD